ncbi:MAG: dockerin type I domain-containing protein [Pirellulaceae bacterium]
MHRPTRKLLASRLLCVESLETRRMLAFVPYVGEVSPGQPVAFLSNGGNGCCVSEVVGQFLRDSGAVVKVTQWNDITNIDGSPTAAGNDPGIFNPVPSDATTFLSQIDEAIAAIPEDSPLLLLGHSWGGNSMLKTAKLTTERNIQFLGLYDPVGDGGFRSNVINDNTNGISGIPANVDYFFNRWQQNSVFFNGVPFDSSSRSGEFIPDGAAASDQLRQDEARNSDGTVVSSSETRLRHSLVPNDDFIEVQTIDAISNFVPFPPLADAGADQIVNAGQTVTVTGLGTDINPADTLSYTWQVAGFQATPEAPLQSVANPLADPNAPSTLFNASSPGIWTFDLTVTDSTGRHTTDRMTVTIRPTPTLSFVKLLDEQLELQVVDVEPNTDVVIVWGTEAGSTYLPQYDSTVSIANATVGTTVSSGDGTQANGIVSIPFTPQGQTFRFQAISAGLNPSVSQVLPLNIAGVPIIVTPVGESGSLIGELPNVIVPLDGAFGIDLSAMSDVVGNVASNVGFAARLAGNQNLPNWLGFDAAGKRFHSAGASVVDQWQVEVSAIDIGSSSELETRSFRLTVESTSNVWHNASEPLDVNRDQEVAPLDALIILNALARGTGNSLNRYRFENEASFDVNNDDLVTPVDALQVINALNRIHVSESEGAPAPSMANAIDLRRRTTLHPSEFEREWNDIDPKASVTRSIVSASQPDPTTLAIERYWPLADDDALNESTSSENSVEVGLLLIAKSLRN